MCCVCIHPANPFSSACRLHHSLPNMIPLSMKLRVSFSLECHVSIVDVSLFPIIKTDITKTVPPELFSHLKRKWMDEYMDSIILTQARKHTPTYLSECQEAALLHQQADLNLKSAKVIPRYDSSWWIIHMCPNFGEDSIPSLSFFFLGYRVILLSRGWHFTCHQIHFYLDKRNAKRVDIPVSHTDGSNKATHQSQMLFYNCALQRSCWATCIILPSSEACQGAFNRTHSCIQQAHMSVKCLQNTTDGNLYFNKCSGETNTVVFVEALNNSWQPKCADEAQHVCDAPVGLPTARLFFFYCTV